MGSDRGPLPSGDCDADGRPEPHTSKLWLVDRGHCEHPCRGLDLLAQGSHTPRPLHPKEASPPGLRGQPLTVSVGAWRLHRGDILKGSIHSVDCGWTG